MRVTTDLNRRLERVFRIYEKEKQLQAQGLELKPAAKKRLEAEERMLALLQMRDNAVDDRKDKRAVPGLPNRGVFSTRDKNSVEEKLRKAYGGKVAKRILQRERLAGRENPEELRIYVNVEREGEMVRESLKRGVDFALVSRPHGEPTLVLHGEATEFTVEYAVDFTHTLT